MQQTSEGALPSDESQKIVAEWAQKIASIPSDMSSWLDNYLANHQQRIAFDFDITTKYMPPGSKILELGSVPPLLTASLSSSDYDVTGVDIAPERLQELFNTLNLNVLKCNIEQDTLPAEDASFDAVIMNEVFEHLRIDLIFSLSEICRVLKPGGKLFLSTPNLRSLRGIYNFLFRNQCYSCQVGIYAQYSKLRDLGHMGHVREYTTQEVIDFLRKIGFEPSTIIYRGNDHSKIARMVSSVKPSLRPFFSCVAEKPA